MIVVLDANVFIAALLKDGGTAFQAIARVLRECTVVVPDQFIRDLYSFAKQARKKGVRIDPDSLLRELAALQEREFLQVVPTKGTCSFSPHEADNRYIEAALITGAQVILTGDQDLTAQNVRERVQREHGIAILSPREFLDFMERE